MQMDSVRQKPDVPARNELWLHATITAWSLVAVYIYMMQVMLPGVTKAFEVFNQILSHSATSPYNYRILVPYVIKVIMAPLSTILEPQTAFFTACVVYLFAAIWLSAMVLFRLLRLWFDVTLSLIGIAMFCLMVAVAARYEFFQPWSLIEPALYAAAIMLGLRRRAGWALLLTVIATPNRETGLFVPLLFCAALPGPWLDRKRILWLTVLGGTWAVIFLGVRAIVGPSAVPYTIRYVFRSNMHSWPIAAMSSVAFFATIFPAVLGARRAPVEIQRCALTLLPFVPLVMVFGMWWEVRHWLPMACIFLPYTLAGLQAVVSPHAGAPEQAAKASG